jgi:branched-chain amino acid transport system substrate-binding protein
MSKSRLVPMLVALAAITALAGCGSSSSSSSGSAGSTSTAGKSVSVAASGGAPITVLAIGDTTGPTKLYGQTHLAGLKAAAAYYNAHGGIAGHRVSIDAVSDNGDDTTAVSDLLAHLNSGSKPTLVDAGSESGDAAALIPALKRQNVFSISLNDGNTQCAANAGTTCPNAFALSESTTNNQTTVAQWLKRRGITKVGLLEEAIANSQAETPQFIAAGTKLGIQHVTVTFPPTAVDLTPEMQTLKAAGVQAVFAEALGPAAGYVLVARAKLQWNVPVVFDTAGSSLDLTKLVPAADTHNAYYEIFKAENAKLDLPGVSAMIKYSKPYGNVGAVPIDVGSSGWDVMVALNAAVVAAGGATDVKSLDAAMLHIPPTTPLRTFSTKLGFSSTDHENVLGSPNDFQVVPVAPIVAGRVG